MSRYQKGETNLDFTEARDSEWQWHQLGYMQVCTSLQTDNHTSTPLLSFLQAELYLILSVIYVKKFNSFSQVLKKDEHKKIGSFFSASQCRPIYLTLTEGEATVSCKTQRNARRIHTMGQQCMPADTNTHFRVAINLPKNNFKTFEEISTTYSRPILAKFYHIRVFVASYINH